MRQRHVEEGDHKTKQERGARAVPGARPHIAADVVRAEEMLGARREVPGCAARLGKVRVAVARFPPGDHFADHGIKETHQHKCTHDGEQQHRGTFFEEGAEGALPVGVVGVSCQLAFFGIKGDALEQALAQRRLEVRFADVHAHPSFLSVSRMRGSSSTIRISPRNTPSTPSAE